MYSPAGRAGVREQESQRETGCCDRARVALPGPALSCSPGLDACGPAPLLGPTPGHRHAGEAQAARQEAAAAAPAPKARCPPPPLRPPRPKRVPVRQRPAGSTCPLQHRLPQPCPSPGRTGSGRFLPGSRSAALRGGAHGRRSRSRPRSRRRRLLIPSGMGRGRAARPPAATGGGRSAARGPLGVVVRAGWRRAGRWRRGGLQAPGAAGGRGFNRTWGRWREAVPGGAAPRLAAPGGGRAETRLQPGESPGQGRGGEMRLTLPNNGKAAAVLN